MSELNIGKVIIDQTKTSQVVVNYADTSKPDTSTITSNRSQMTATVESITTAFEASKTYYFDENGNPVTTNQGYGTLGTTDSNGVLTVAHSIPSITALTTDPESPEPATNFELSGESTCLVGEELTLQYSTDDSTWLPLGVATVQPDGTWSKADCQIADAGSYYLRAIYGAEVVESASISVVVASAYTEGKIMIAGTNSNYEYSADFSNDSGVNFSEMQYDSDLITSSLCVDGDGKYGMATVYQYLHNFVDGVATKHPTLVTTSRSTNESKISKNGQHRLIVYVDGYAVSNDYGATWTKTAKDSFYRCDMSESGQYMVVVEGASGGGIHYSNDYGANWSKLSRNMADTATSRIKISADGLTFWFLMYTSNYGYLYKVTNGISTVTQVHKVPNNTSIIQDFDISDNGQSIALKIYNINGAWRMFTFSADGGSTWVDGNNLPVYAGSKSVVRVAGNASTIYVVDSGGYLHKLSSPFTSTSSTGKLVTFVEVGYSGNTIIAGKNAGKLFTTVDGGANWVTSGTNRAYSLGTLNTKKV